MTTVSAETESAPAPEAVRGATLDRPLEAADLAAFEAWLQTRAGELGFSLKPDAVQDQTDIYLDTEDWRFYRASYALRLRRPPAPSSIVAQLRGLDETDGSPSSPEPRLKASEPIANGYLETLRAAPGPVGERLRALAGPAAIRPLFAVQTRRKTLTLAREAELAAEVITDEARILRSAGQEPARFGRVRFKAQGPAADTVAALVQAGCLEGVVRLAGRSLYAAGLEALALVPDPAPEYGPTEINETSSLGELALAVLRRQFALLLRHEPGARLGDDPEGVHRMRVASRRLRAALSLFAECLPARAAHFRDELRWVAAGLGEVRDIDVQLERLETWQAEITLADQAVLEPLKTVLEGQRARARARLLAMLDSRRYAHFAAGFAAMIKSGLSRRQRPAGSRPALEAAPPLMVDRYHQMCQAGDDLTEASPPQAFHALRIRGKRLRYALEFTAEIYGEPAAELQQNVVALQDLLGLHQDAFVAMAQLRALTETHGRQLPPATIFAMGEVTQRYVHLVADCRQRFPEVYAQVRGKPWKRLRQAMKARQAPDELEAAQ